MAAVLIVKKKNRKSPYRNILYIHKMIYNILQLKFRKVQMNAIFAVKLL